MDRETHALPTNTKEFVALWNSAKEEHFVSQVVPLLPHLFSGPVRLDPERAEWAARHLVRAMYFAATPEAGVPAAISYLMDVVEGRGANVNPSLRSGKTPAKGSG